MAVGDVNSTAPGSGARYNDGKPQLDLIPVWILLKFGLALPRLSTREIVGHLSQWQSGQLQAQHIIGGLDYDDARMAARVFEYGAKKYAAWNWIRGMQWSVPLGCALRHAFAEMGGEAVDSESKLTHRGHLVCNLVMLAQFESTYPEGDDRPLQWLNPSGVEVVRTGGSACLEDFESALAAGISSRRKRGQPPGWKRDQCLTPLGGRSTDTWKTPVL